jgi:tetratricopeptide (TPR) repeat protein
MKLPLHSLALVLGLSFLVQAGQDLRTLEPGKAVEREIAGGESHAYQVKLTAGQFMRVMVDQKGIDLVVALIAPNREQLVEANILSSGQESLSHEVAVSGDYRIIIRTLAATAPKAEYEVQLEVKAAVTAQDKQRIAAEGLLAEAGKLSEQGDATLEQTVEKAQQALALWRGLGDRYWQAHTLHLIGYAYSSSRKNDQAIEAYNQALEIFREIKDRYGEANILCYLGWVYNALNRYEKGIEYNQQALAIARELKYPFGQASALNNLGIANRSLGRYEKAIEYLEQSLALAREIKNRRSEAAALSALGNQYLLTSRYEQAIAYYEQAIGVAREVKDRRSEGTYLNNLGVAYANLERYEKAIEFHEQALKIAREVKNRINEGNILTGLGTSYRLMGRLERHGRPLHSGRRRQVPRHSDDRRFPEGLRVSDQSRRPQPQSARVS